MRSQPPPPDFRRRADRLFDAALDLGAAERRAFLDAQCQEPQLRALVEALLADTDAEEQDSTLLMESSGGQGALWDDLYRELADGEAEPEPGTVGRYRILREVGRGGMAVVFLAERADGQFEQRVALKRIQSGIDTEEVLKRFDQERQILARAQHPNIAGLLDGGVDDQGRPFCVMEYVEGRPIDRYCDEECLSVDRRLELFLQVARAVDYAHRNLVVHRDLKPSNTLVTGDGHVKLLDFGIAKLLDAPETAPVTRTDVRLMTPVYASPEQIRGEPVTTASDIYQLGLLLYLLLTGRGPYPKEAGASNPALAQAICEDPPTRPSHALEREGLNPEGAGTRSREAVAESRGTNAQRLRRRLVGDLDNIVLMALRKEPERRYRSVAQLIDDIEHHLGGRPVSARPDTFFYRAGKLVQRYRGVVATAAAALLLIVALVIFYTVEVTRQRDRAQNAAMEAQQVSTFLRSLFEVAAPTRSQGEQITARQLLDRGASRIEEELAGQPAVQAEMMTLMGEVYRELALYEEAVPLLERAEGIRREGGDPVELAESLHALAQVREESGDLAGARRLYEEALRLRREALGEDDPQVARTLTGLGRVLTLSGDFDLARDYHEGALRIFERSLGPKDPEVGRTLQSLGEMLRTVREFESARPHLERALRILEESFGSDHTYVAQTRMTYGEVLRFTGYQEEARREYEAALPILERVYGPDHPEVAVALTKLGHLLSVMEEADGAIAGHRRALLIREAAFGADSVWAASSLNNLGMVYWIRKGEFSTARELLQRSLEIYEQSAGVDHPEVDKVLRNLAGVEEAQEDFDRAYALYQRSVEYRERVYGPDHSLLSPVISRLGILRWKMGDPAAAVPLLQRAISLGRDQGAHRQGEIVQPQLYLARCWIDLERPEEAAALLFPISQDASLDEGFRKWAREMLEEIGKI
jgi:serine/threonine-protein kinase